MKEILKEFALNVLMSIILVVLVSYIILSIGKVFEISDISKYTHKQVTGILMALNLIFLPWRWHEITQHNKDVEELKFRDRGRISWMLVSTGVISFSMVIIWGLIYTYSIL